MIHRPRRNSMLPELVQAEMMIKFNAPKSEQPDKDIYDTDIDSDIEEPDDVEQQQKQNEIIALDYIRMRLTCTLHMHACC